MADKNKENAYYDFLKMVKRSWTWAKLSIEERDRFVSNIFADDFQGRYEQRLQGYSKCYALYLYGLGYNDSPRWRATEAECAEMPLF